MDLFSGYLFCELEEDHLQQIAAFTSEIPMQSGDKLFSEGEKAEKIYILKEGAVELMSRVRSDFELPISMVRDPGDIFGASALILPHEYSLSAACAETGSVLRIERSSLMNLIVKDRDLG
jgi:CRP/FNR family transcriptional regulator